jgi:large subunit ribosomal protein L22
MKRVRPAPMGRAYRVLKRTAHLTVHVSERPERVVAVVESAPAPRKRARATGGAAAGAAGAKTARAARTKKAKE